MWVAMGILALTAGMFFLLPRTADAALSRLISHRIRVPGFSSRVTLGEIGEFQTSSRPVMHVAIHKNQPMGSAKWRGSVLTQFDGKVWSNPSLHFRELKTMNGLAALGYGPGQRQRSYRVDWEDLDSQVLFIAGAPEDIAVEGPPATLEEDAETGCYRVRPMRSSNFRYQVASVLEDPPETAPPLNPPPVLSLAKRTVYLQIPAHTDPRISRLAETMTAGATTDLSRTRALEQHLRLDYAYTLDLPQKEPADPLANFLFVRRKGHCEYFASAMAVMLRTLGIPSRMVTGFQNGEYNSISDLWVVRASDAHSWVEAWIPGHGWATFDPTPPDFSSHRATLFSRAGLYLDAAETFWQQWVVGYDPNHQGTLADLVEQTARRLGLGWLDSLLGAESGWLARLKEWVRRFGLATGAVLLLGYLVWMGGPPLYRLLRMRRRVERVRRGQANVGDATLLYERMLHVVKRQGYSKPTWFTPLEFARSLPATPMGQAVQEFTGAYNALRFGGHTEASPRLSALLDDLERAGKV